MAKKPTWAQKLKAENAELTAQVAELTDVNQIHLKQIGNQIDTINRLRADLAYARSDAEQHRQTALALTEAQIVGAIGRGGRFSRLKDHLTVNEVAV